MSETLPAPQVPSPLNRTRQIEHNRGALELDKRHSTTRDRDEDPDTNSYAAEFERLVGGAGDTGGLLEKLQTDKIPNPYNDKFGVCDMLHDVLSYCHELPDVNQREHLMIAPLQLVIDKIRDQLEKAGEVPSASQDPYVLHQWRQNTSEAGYLVRMVTDSLNLFLNEHRLVSARVLTMARRDEMLQVVARLRHYWSPE